MRGASIYTYAYALHCIALDEADRVLLYAFYDYGPTVSFKLPYHITVSVMYVAQIDDARYV